MNLKRTLSAAVVAFALTMMPAFVACSPDDNKTDIETPTNRIIQTLNRNRILILNLSQIRNLVLTLSRQLRQGQNGSSFLPSMPRKKAQNTLLMQKIATCTMRIIFAQALRNMPTTGIERETTPYASAKVIIARYGWLQSGTTVFIR